jgi:predicted permease
MLSAVSRSVSRRRGVAQRVLVAGELALCLVLLVGAGLLARSLTLLTAVDPGFRAEGLAVVRVSMPRSRYQQDTARTREFYQAAMTRIAAVPGVERVSTTSGAPFDGSSSSTTVGIGGSATNAAVQEIEGEYRIVMPGYFETIGIPLIGGRTFTDGDRGATRPIIINATLARRGWPNESAVGKQVRYDDEWHTVVGVVGDVKNAGLAAEPQAMFYVSALQVHGTSQRFVIRAAVGADALALAVREIIASLDPSVPVTAIDEMPALLSRSIAEPRYRTMLISLFGVIAALLATIGVYGVTARAVSQHTREIGIRMALGSSGGAVIRLFISRTMTGVVVGVVAGLAGAFAASRLLAPYLFGVKPSDPPTFAAVLSLMVVVSAVASWLPARLASRTNPAVVLRRG